MKFEMIAFDADDTLWQAEIHFRDAQEELKQILSVWEEPETIDKVMYEIEMRNLPQLGYGVKAFVLSMIEAAVKISAGEIRGETIEKILSIGRSMLEMEVGLRPHVAETLYALSKSHRMMIITKGDLLDQTAKVARSGLAKYFSLVEVVNEKTPESYGVILEKYHLDPHTFLMVGNSLKSDILPILELGGKAVHIPADTTWAHEMVSDFDKAKEGFYELEHIGQLPGLISEIS